MPSSARKLNELFRRSLPNLQAPLSALPSQAASSAVRKLSHARRMRSVALEWSAQIEVGGE